MGETRDFVQKVYYPDMLAIAGPYKDWFSYGAGVTNYLAVPELPEDTRNTKFALPGGIIAAATSQMRRSRPIAGPDLINEHQGKRRPRLVRGEQQPAPLGGRNQAQLHRFQENGKYSWCKAPRPGWQAGAGRAARPDPCRLRGRTTGRSRSWWMAAVAKIGVAAQRPALHHGAPSARGPWAI